MPETSNLMNILSFGAKHLNLVVIGLLSILAFVLALPRLDFNPAPRKRTKPIEQKHRAPIYLRIATGEGFRVDRRSQKGITLLWADEKYTEQIIRFFVDNNVKPTRIQTRREGAKLVLDFSRGKLPQRLVNSLGQ